MAIINPDNSIPAKIKTLEITPKTITDYISTSMGRSYQDVIVPEMTYAGIRIDIAIINTERRAIRGFEIKMTRADFIKDEKWALYSQFCSSLTMVCPEGLIKREEIEPPFGLFHVKKEIIKSNWSEKGEIEQLAGTWVRKPKYFQSKDGLAWFWTYLKVIESEIVRQSQDCQKCGLRHKY